MKDRKLMVQNPIKEMYDRSLSKQYDAAYSGKKKNCDFSSTNLTHRENSNLINSQYVKIEFLTC